jgi:hypothetical protein
MNVAQQRNSPARPRGARAVRAADPPVQAPRSSSTDPAYVPRAAGMFPRRRRAAAAPGMRAKM